MNLPLQVISTDFDGTVHSELEEPHIPHPLQDLLAGLQSEGVVWIINTGRDLPSLTEALEDPDISIRPDYVVTVEREIYQRHGRTYIAWDDWNDACRRAHDGLFETVRGWIPEMTHWIKTHSNATLYEDSFSPFCVIASSPEEADRIQRFLEEFTVQAPELAVVRNHIYMRLSHIDFNKGSALRKICERLGAPSEKVFAAGDHYNDLPMLQSSCARWLLAPDNAIDEVKAQVLEHEGYVSPSPYGHGVVEGIEQILGAGRFD